jgi:hypothetical protein
MPPYNTHGLFKPTTVTIYLQQLKSCEIAYMAAFKRGIRAIINDKSKRIRFRIIVGTGNHEWPPIIILCQGGSTNNKILNTIVYKFLKLLVLPRSLPPLWKQKLLISFLFHIFHKSRHVLSYSFGTSAFQERGKWIKSWCCHFPSILPSCDV